LNNIRSHHDLEARRGASQFSSRSHRLQRRPPFSDWRTRQGGIAALQIDHIQSEIKNVALDNLAPDTTEGRA